MGVSCWQSSNCIYDFFLFAEKRIKRFDESRFQGREMK